MHSYPDREKLARLFAVEVAEFVAKHPASEALHQKASGPLMAGVPMSWMAKWPGPHPIFVQSAKAGGKNW